MLVFLFNTEFSHADSICGSVFLSRIRVLCGAAPPSPAKNLSREYAPSFSRSLQKDGSLASEGARATQTKRCKLGSEIPMSDTGKAQKTTIAPMLSVRGGAKAVDFYKAAFGAEEVFRLDAPDGTVVAQLSVGEAQFWVADESPEHLNFSPQSLGGGSVRMVMTVEDPNAAFDRAIAAGAKEISPVQDEYGWRLGRIVDPFGHHWEIGKPLPE
jgi:PhnB protein